MLIEFPGDIILNSDQIVWIRPAVPADPADETTAIGTVAGTVRVNLTFKEVRHMLNRMVDVKDLLRGF